MSLFRSGFVAPKLLSCALALLPCFRILADDSMIGDPQTLGVAIQQTTADITQAEFLQLVQTHVLHVHPSYRFGPPPNAATGTASGPQSPPAGPLGQQTVSSNINFTAATFFDCSGWPPDTMGTVGPTQFIIALNGRVRSFNKATGQADGAIDVNTDSFFASVLTPGANFSTDPRIRYDRLSGRWFIIMIDVPGQQGNLPNRVMIAVSDSGIISPSTVWSFYQFAGDATNFADYPTLGIDANALYIGANIFSTSSGFFVNTTVFVVRKSSILNGGPIVVTTFTGLISGHGFSKSGPYTPQGVDNFNPAATEGYIIGVDNSSLSTLQLRRISNPGGTPAISGNVSISVGTFNQPINVTVSGTSGTVDGLDRRLLAAHFRNGSLWTSHNVAVNSTGGTSSADRNGVRWYQITNVPTGQTPTIAQSGTVFQSGSNPRSYWMGTIMVSGQGHAAMGFTSGGPNDFLNAATTGRLVGDASGAMGAPTLYTASSAAYTPTDGTSPHRWGDYSYTSVDPSDDMTMWTIQEWSDLGGNGYAVQVAKLLAPPPALPVACVPNSVTQGVANVTLSITGSTAAGAGFFDPGAGFSNHISTLIAGGGITVNSLGYNNPSNITVNVSVAGNATPGSRVVSVTNPDAQTASSATGILTVIASGPTTNHPPNLAAIPDRTNFVGASLIFTNVASDTDSPPQTLAFTLGAGAPTNATIGPATGVFSWTPVQAQIGSNHIRVIVTDNGTPPLSATQSFAVTVIASNHPPTLTPIPNQTTAVGMTVTFTNSASDTDSPPQTLTFSLATGAPTNATIGASSGIFTWTPVQSQIGTNTFAVVVTDNGFPPMSATQTVQIAVLASNHPPILASIPNQTTAVGMTLTFTNSASDTDSPPQALTFSLAAGAPTNASIGVSSGIFTWTPVQSQIGTNTIGVVVKDNGFPPMSTTQTVQIAVLASNHPPILAAISNRVTAVGMTVTFTNSASDTDSPPQALAFSLDAGAPTNAAVDASTGVFSWTPVQSQIGTNSLAVIVTDNGLPPLSATQTFTVVVVVSNSPPTLATVSDRAVHSGVNLVITNTATDPDAPPQTLTFDLQSGPPGATLGSTDGVLSWTPNDTQLGSNFFAVRVTDNGLPNLSNTKSFAVNVFSRPTLQISVTDNITVLDWASLTGTTYRVQYIPDFSETSWLSLPGDVFATGAVSSVTDTNQAPNRLYRLQIVP